MTETLQLRLTGGRDAARRARSALASLNGELAGMRDTVRLLVTELVTNSFLHAGANHGDPIEVRVLATPRVVRVEVADQGPGFEPAPPSPGPHGGFGLLLVDELADRWGVASRSPCRVWFELDRVRAA